MLFPADSSDEGLHGLKLMKCMRLSILFFFSNAHTYRFMYIESNASFSAQLQAWPSETDS